MIHFPRKALAESVIRKITGQDELSDAPNGLFLAAPRRTGKSMFLQHDLIPLLEEKKITPIYVDLWANRAEDPGALIAGVIARRAKEERNLLQAIRESVRGKVDVGPLGLDLDFSQLGKPGGPSIPEALQKIFEATGKKICLIVDEAQHALTTEAGNNATSALKSARDQLNSPGKTNLMLIMSGSDRDKLLRLVNTNAAPFYGSSVDNMPTLQVDYCRALAREIEQNHERAKPVDPDALFKAFELYRSRPQFLANGILAALDKTTEVGTFNEKLLNEALTSAAAAEEEMASLYLGLPSLQQAILWRILEMRGNFRPFDANALKFYSEKTGQKVSAAQVQPALESLRSLQDPIIWKSVRGEYSVEDTGMIKWFTALKKEGNWPPKVN